MGGNVHTDDTDQAPVGTIESAPEAQPADTPGKDENADGATAGQATADNHGDVLGI